VLNSRCYLCPTGGEEHELLAYQVAFDLADNELQVREYSRE
jgi:hypothetical protein